MKFFYSKVSIIAASTILTLLFSCSPDKGPLAPPTPEEPEIVPPVRTFVLSVDDEPLFDMLSFTKQETKVEVAVKCDSAWSVSISEQRWAVVSSDRAKDSFTLTIANENMEAEWREALITLTSGDVVARVKIRQAGSDASATVGDSLVLVKLYNALDGAYWKSKQAKEVEWELDKPMDSWHGVKMNDERRVEALMLSGLGLDGVMPPQIGMLTQLKVLDINGNSVKGEIPEQIGKLGKLEKLLINDNKFTGELPSTIAELKYLREITGQGNRFKIFPVEICSLDSLTSINLQYNEIDQLPGEVTSMSRLKYLYLNHNRLVVLPLGLDKMPSLVYLHAQDNLIRKLPDELGLLTNLVSLNLANNKIEGQIPASIINLTTLKYLYLGGNEIGGEIPQGMDQMKALEVIELDHNKIGGIMPDWGLNTKLIRLRMGGNNLQGDITAHFASCPVLQEVSLVDNQLSGTIPEGLANVETAPKLTYLALSNNNLTGTLPVAFVDQLTKWNPGFNKFGFMLYGNRLSGEIPAKIYSAGLGNLHTQFKFATNVYPQQENYGFTNEK